jgi:hypothetical protein
VLSPAINRSLNDCIHNTQTEDKKMKINNIVIELDSYEIEAIYYALGIGIREYKSSKQIPRTFHLCRCCMRL